MQWKESTLDRTDSLPNLKGLTIFITGGNRGIGLCTAMLAARDGANIAVVAKTSEPHPKLPETIYTAADKLTQAGGNVLPIKTDIRDEESVKDAVNQTVEKFGGIDILVNNASALSIAGTEGISMKAYDLSYGVTVRGTFMVTKYCLPHLLKSEHAHMLTMSPPLTKDPNSIKAQVPYGIAKQLMSMIAHGIAAEHPSIRSNCLWPKTVIATSAISNTVGEDFLKQTRSVDIMGQAAYEILLSKHTTGKFLFDDEVLIPAMGEFADCDPLELYPDLFI